jgi:hypothetical protein
MGPMGPTGPGSVLVGGQYGLGHYRKNKKKFWLSGEEIKPGIEIVDGGPYICYDKSTGMFVIANPGKYIVHCMFYVSKLINGHHTEINFVLNGKTGISHDIILEEGNTLPICFTDIIQITDKNSELSIVNCGLDIVFNGLVKFPAIITIWGLGG